MIWTLLIWAGAALSLAGLGGILWSILTVLRARRAGLPDAELRSRLQSSLTTNMIALAVSVIGLMLVVLGVMLGP